MRYRWRLKRCDEINVAVVVDLRLHLPLVSFGMCCLKFLITAFDGELELGVLSTVVLLGVIVNDCMARVLCRIIKKITAKYCVLNPKTKTSPF